MKNEKHFKPGEASGGSFRTSGLAIPHISETSITKIIFSLLVNLQKGFELKTLIHLADKYIYWKKQPHLLQFISICKQTIDLGKQDRFNLLFP